jgi:TrpR-related protein YerC/YecD
MKNSLQKHTDELYGAILKLESVEECRRFFRDLLTETEIEEFSQRWKAARMLAEGVSYSQIEEETGLSSRTIARVGQWLRRGEGGYALMVKKTK